MSTPRRGVCVECGKTALIRSHGLCGRCYYQYECGRLGPPRPPQWARCGRCKCHLPPRKASRHPSGLCAACRDSRGVPPSVVDALTILATSAVDPGPCDALQGSGKKLAVLIRRQELGLPLFDQGDQRGE